MSLCPLNICLSDVSSLNSSQSSVRQIVNLAAKDPINTIILLSAAASKNLLEGPIIHGVECLHLAVMLGEQYE